MSQSDLPQVLNKLAKEAKDHLDRAQDLSRLQEWSQTFLGKKSPFKGLFEQLKTLSPEEKKRYGPLVNDLRNELEAAYKVQYEALQLEHLNQKLKDDRIDVTKTFPVPQGSLHPLSQVQQQVEEAFSSMGFEIVDGPQVETEWHNFDALNIPPNHPARDMQDTFFIKTGSQESQENLVLRTHTSNLQIRSLLSRGVPLRVAAPGRVFRNEALDATHDAVFYQVEGMIVDKNISIGHLKGVLEVILSRVFEKEIRIRVRPGYFPFVEPGLEVDIWWEYIDKEGEKRGRWLEFCGAGMVHPNVLRNCEIDPDVYNGFAFGFGLTRLVMMRYGIEDIRHLFSLKKEFLEQF